MKDKIQKLAGLNQEMIELIKEQKMDEVVEKMAEIQILTKEMDEAVETTQAWEDAEAIAKKENQEKLEKAMVEIKKYTSLNISADTIKGLIDQVNELKETIATWNDTIIKRLETVESAKGISKQATEVVEKQWENIWDSLEILN